MNLLLVLILATSAVEVVAEIYKWKDDKGKIHYSDNPAKNSRQMDIKDEPSENTNISKSQRKNRREKLIETFNAERKEKKQHQAEEKDKRDRLNAQCGRAKDRLKGYMKAGGLYNVDKEGNRTYISKEEHKAEIRNLQKRINKQCK